MCETGFSRRDFALVIAGLGGAVRCAGSNPWKPLLSTSSVHFRTLPLEQACAAISKAGYTSVDFWPSSFKCPHLEQIETLGAAGFSQLLDTYRLRLAAFTSYNLPSLRYSELLGRVGGGVLVRESKYGKVQDLRAEMAAFFEALKPDLEAAEKHNYFLAIENHENALLSSVDSFRAFVEMSGNPRLGIAVAPYHLQKAGIRQSR